ncbi:HAD-IC family P-type ATPase [Mycolicibacter sp. MYC123]|uniref:HAD-IC family P-type ATPase n=1 Tax=[Mycobacterium] zoologicum TaxID=2872311 RepID=A0ABU5YED3_9MYCO|nr:MULTISPECIES: HAD-IC family P-type ATPase [unclassified Mycolicibacter]MEB3048409.1 HAD-IC family P-type ATPase [Mycolicibacter sp. MYC123]MEB3063857.1 HAD-IC family P-type ATPase [Mycolicibacter sp. MYC101]
MDVFSLGRLGLDAVGAVASASLDLAAIPLREGAKILSGERSDLTSRRSWRGAGRAWIEVRGLDEADGDDVGTAVLEALRAQPGVTSVRLNRPLSRVVVEVGEQTALSDLCAAVEAVEKGAELTANVPAALPGDGLLLATKGAMVGANAVGLAIATAGSVLRWPAAPKIFDAAASVARYQPLVRSALESRIGPARTEAVLSLASLGSHIITMSPAILAVDMMVEGLKASETRAGALAWNRYEPELARYADHPEVCDAARPVPRPDGPAERHLKRTALVQVVGAGVVGGLTRNLDMTSNAILAASPKAVRTSCESFAAALGQGLADQHGVLPLRPGSLRRLDKIDTVVIDPRALTGAQSRVVQIRGAGEHELPKAWSNAQDLLDKAGLRPGWHRVPRMTVRGSTRKVPVEALILPAHHALASAVVLEGRASGAELVTVDTEILGELRPGFDDIRPVPGDDLDAALAAAVTDLQRAGRTVAVLSTSAAQALASADLGLGVMPDGGDDAPPFYADLLLTDLTGAWQVLRALPAARTASERGVAISIGASSIAGLLLVRGVRATIPGVGPGPSRGPGPVTVGAGAGMLSGYLLARRVLRARAPKPAPAYEWHAMTVEQARELLAPDAVTPLAERAPVDAESQGMFWPYFHAVREELSDPMTPILALCSAATAMLGSPIDAVMVGTVLTGNAMLAAYQRLRAESRLNTLLAQQAPPARVLVVGGDNPTYHEIPAEQLLPGDLIEVHSNEVVPADARVLEVSDVEVDESSLTGESLSVGKQLDPTPGAELAERSSMLYAGTTVIAGKVLAMVTAVGADTQARRASELASGELAEVGLQHHLSQLMYRTFPYSAAGGVAVGALGLLRQGGLRVALGNAIAVAIAAVPEGMPLMATLAQHASSQRLTKSGALVRIPRSVEALGRVDVVCFDKTGTLSENRLRVTTVRPLAGFSDDDVLGSAAQAAPAPDGAAHAHATDQAIVEGAAAATGARAWIEPDAHLPFRSGRAFSASVLGTELLVKGAPEVVLGACTNAGAKVEQQVDAMAAQGLRVIAVAQGKLTAAQVRAVRDDSERLTEVSAAGLTLIGFLGLADTPRADAPQLLADLATRGVDIRMITGDHPITATAIAAEMGVNVAPEQVITGSEWNALNRKEQERVVCERVIFARMSPENKVQIVQTLERAGRVSAMVGDGANDAAAIRAATVGLGVVAHGSDSAHATADVVLTDGKIGALVDAIDEGRRLWRGVQLAISGLLGGNAGEVMFSVIGTAITGNSPLNTRQLLLMNTLTDALPATAVAVSTPAGPIGDAVPGLDERKLWRAVAFRGGVTGAAGTAAWAMASVTGTPQRASTVALISLVTTELGQTVVDSRAPLVLATAAGSFVLFAAMVSTPGVSQLLGCTPVGPVGWAQAVGTAAAATAAVAVASRFSAPAKEIEAAPKEVAKAVAEVAPVKKAPAKKAVAKKAPVQKVAVAKKAPAKKVAVAKKAPVKKASAAKKTAAKKAPAKKAAAKKSSAKLELVR